jgi:hypothetical protein
MYCRYLVAFLILLLNACGGSRVPVEADLEASAEQFFRGVYGCNASVIDELASEDIVVTYPLFERVFSTPALRGRETV